MKTIYDRVDQTKIIFHSIYIKKVINMADWGSHPSDLQTLPNHDTPYCYHDYMKAWLSIFLYQNLSHSHLWFFQFDHKFNSQFPYWFLQWWDQYGPELTIFPESLQY